MGVVVVTWPGRGNLAELASAASTAEPDADLGVLAADASAPPDGWSELAAAAYGDDTTAMATYGRCALPAGAVARVIAPDPACTLIRRDVYELLGGFDPALSDPPAALLDFAARARQTGLTCVLCPEPDAAAPAEHGRPTDAGLTERYPWLAPALSEEQAPDPGPLRRALIAGQVRTRAITLTIDARSLGTGVGGTQTYVGGLLLALAATGAVRVRAVLASDSGAPVRPLLAEAGIELVDYEAAATGELPRTDLVHRPQQVFTPHDLRLCQLLGERLVVSHLDLIAYRAPNYHVTPETWQSYRRTTRLALAAADAVLFFSEHARDDALSEDLVPPERAHVAGIGVRPAPPAAERAERPPAIPEGRRLLAMVGTDYAHKNRAFAARLVAELRTRHGWDGVLVLAGPHVPHGAGPPIPDSPDTIDLGPISEAEKGWLLSHADALLAPSVYEGFGLAPLEAAAAGIPCLFAAVTSLRELVDSTAAAIVPWDPVASAAAAAPLLDDGPARAAHLGLLSDALARYRWERVTAQVLAAYERSLSMPFRAAAPRAWAELEREQLLVDQVEAYGKLERRIGDGLPLIDTGAPLLTPDVQRGLMRVAARRWLRGPLLGAFGVLGRAAGPARKPSP